MGVISEEISWEEEIYQIEKTDRVQGGPNGISNRQAQQLSNRTAWLKEFKAPLKTSLSAEMGSETDTGTLGVPYNTIPAILQTIWGKIRQVANVVNSKADRHNAYLTGEPTVPDKTRAARNDGMLIATEAQVYLKANDTAVVKLTGDQTIAGTKTFSSSPIVPSKNTAATDSPTVIATEAQVAQASATMSTELGKKQNILTAGYGITINGDTISLKDISMKRFVAVSNGSPGSTAAAYSDNGITWTAATLPSSANWSSIAYGDDKFVAVSIDSSNSPSNIAAYSYNGIILIRTTLPSSQYWTSVAYGNGRFAAVSSGIGTGNGNGGSYFPGIGSSTGTTAAAYSDNGITWSATPLPRSANWSSIAYGNGRFVAVSIGTGFGSSGGGGSSPGSNVAAYSDDGIWWYELTLPATVNWTSITYGNGRFVAVSSHTGSTGSSPGSTVAAYSDNGITWTAATLPSSANWTSVTCGNGRFVAVGAPGSNNINGGAPGSSTGSTAAAYSDNGITWTAATLPSSANWSSIAYGDDKFVAVSGINISGTTAAAYSDNGITWTAATLPSSERWSSITYSKI